MPGSGVEGLALVHAQRRALGRVQRRWLSLTLLPSLALVTSLATLALAGGCDSDPDAFPPEEACPSFDYNAFDAATVRISFSADVAPVFANNCTENGCHGSALTPASGLFLGPNPNARATPGEPLFPADLATRQDIVTSYLLAPARTTRDLPRVMAGAPEQSLLMHKLDGSHACIELACPGNDCGQRMPRGKPQLAATSRDIIRSWIAQGALAD